MGKIYTTPFDWGYVDDNTLIYTDTSEEGIKSMINEALDEAIDDVKEEIVDETMSSMDIKLEGGNLLYKLIVNGNENGEINIPKDQFLKSTSYDKENKKLIFVMETEEGENTIEVSISDLVASIEEKNQEQDVVLEEKADKSELEPLATKEEVQAVDAKVDALEIPSVDGFAKAEEVTAEIAAAVEPLATKAEVEAVDAKVDAIDLTPYATVEALNQESERATAKETEIEEALNVEAQRATAAESELQGKDAELLAKIDQVKSDVETELEAKADKSELEPLATKEEMNALDEKKVDWTESTPGRKHIVLKNHDSVLGTATDGGTYNVAMVSKWDVADFGSAQLHLNLNSKDAATINDNKVIATEDFVADSIATAVEPLATKQEVNDAAANAVAQVIANAPEDFDTLKEVADYIASDKTKASEIEATLNEHGASIEALVSKDVEMEAAKADKSELEPLAKKVDVTAEIAAAVEPLATKAEVEAVDEKKVDWTESTPGRKHIVLKNHDSVLGTATDGNTYNVAMVSKWDVADFGSAQLHLNLNTSDEVTINDNYPVATQKWVGEQGFLTEHQDISELATKDELDDAVASAIAEVVANAPEDLNTLKEVADYIASDKTKATEIESKLAQHDATIETLATKAEVQAVDAKVDALVIPSIEGLAVASEVAEDIATAVAPLATKTEVEAVDAKVDAIVVPSIEGLASEEYVDEKVGEKADAADVYTKTESDELFQPYGEYVPVEDYNALIQKVAALENYVNIFIKDREEKMDEIINNMDADNKEVVIETPMESIVVPETTTAYTITAPLADNSTVELTSPKYMTLFNTSEEPVSTTIGHTFVEGETTSATTVYLVGDFDTLTLENVSPAVKSGYDAASVNNVVITEDNVKNLTLALDIQDGATITNNSNASITIQDKNDMATTLTIVAPNSTVTLNGSNYEVVNATVSGDTLIIKKNVGHIDTLNVAKGNVIVEVPRQSLIDEKIGEYTLAEGYTIDYLHDEINSTNVANLAKEGTHTLVEDVTKTGNFSVGTFSSDDMIWELNGHSITSSNTRGYGVFRLRGSAHLEVNDSVGTGVVKNTDDDYGLWTGTVGSKIVINGGHFEASTHVLYAEKGTIEVNGGSFKLTNWETADKDENGNLRFLINCHDADYVSGDAKIIVRGGKFYDFDPGNCAAEGAGTSFLAEGYVSVESTEMIDGVQHKVYTVQAVN